VHANSEELYHEYGFGLVDKIETTYDAVIISVAHKEYLAYDDAYFASITNEGALIADIKGAYRGKIVSRNYWSL